MITHRSLVAAFILGSLSLAWQPAFADDDPPLDLIAAKIELLEAKTQGVADQKVANKLTEDALTHIGTRYRFGGSTPQTGFDCSGLVRWVFDQSIGMVLPRRAAELAQIGAKVDVKNLKPGDLVFFNTLRKTFSHVGIYLGEGQFVHAPSKGGSVRVETIDDAYWRARFSGARRVADGSDLPAIR